MIDAAEHLSNGGGVGQHADGALHLGQVSSGNDRRGLAVDAALETSGAPVHKLDGALGLDDGHSLVHVLGDHVSAVHQASGHVLSCARIALGHHVAGLKHGAGQLGNRVLLVVGLLGAQDGGVRAQHKVDARVRHQVGLELVHVHVQGSVKAQRSSQRRDDLSNQAVQVGVRGLLNIQLAAAHVVDGLIVQHEGDISVLQKRVSGQDRVVGLDDGSGHLRRGVHAKVKLGLLSVVDGQALQQERAESGSGSSSDTVEDQESLQSAALIGQLANAVQSHIDELASNGVVSARVVVGGVLLARDELLRVVQLAVSTGANLVHDSGLEIDKDGARHVLARASLGKEGVEGAVLSSDRLVSRHGSVRRNAVFQAVEFPAAVSNLNSGLSNVQRNDLTPEKKENRTSRKSKRNKGGKKWERKKKKKKLFFKKKKKVTLRFKSQRHFEITSKKKKKEQNKNKTKKREKKKKKKKLFFLFLFPGKRKKRREKWRERGEEEEGGGEQCLHAPLFEFCALRAKTQTRHTTFHTDTHTHTRSDKTKQ